MFVQIVNADNIRHNRYMPVRGDNLFADASRIVGRTVLSTMLYHAHVQINYNIQENLYKFR